MSRSQRRIRWAVLALVPVVWLAGGEAFLRYRAHVLNQETLEAAFSVPREEALGGRVRFIDIIRPDPNPKIIYELRPELDTTYKGRRLTTNVHGFRGRAHPAGVQPETVKIVGIGASIMFGHGVDDGQEYLALLEAGLERAFPEKTWRVVNTAVPSYNVVMKVETLKQKGLAWGPDLVILNVASNNLELPNYIRVADDPRRTDKSFLLDLFGERLRRRREGADLVAGLARVDKERLSWHQSAVTDPQKIPPEYRDLVGWEPFERALDELRDLARPHDFGVIVFSNLDVDITSRMLREARERGFHSVCLMDDIAAWFEHRLPGEELTIERYTESELVVGPGDAHPSALQHRMIALRLQRELRESGMLARLLDTD